MIPAHGSYVQMEHWYPDTPRRRLSGTPKKRKHIERMNALLLASSGLCGICGRSIDGEYGTADHVVPRAQGGPDDGNLVPAHKACNQRKSGRLPTGCETIWLTAVNARLAVPA